MGPDATGPLSPSHPAADLRRRRRIRNSISALYGLADEPACQSLRDAHAGAVAGGPYHPQYLSRLLGRYTAELGLPRLTAHGLRHTCATLMLTNGVPPKVAAEQLGHADPTLFTNLYSHVTPTMQREAEKLGAALFS